ncbi:GSCOCG00001045001-RA-CDS [Cotesia congregata]|uniref:Similar to Atf3: Activating transcription factor 3 (Drosophila melanogaster) n=1 Tax=Cotesia congregata TaxID=51543 RepID=A0A8J2MU87_COTCN|nr:GSCOCG00001045001-RA-CDS [Cotesia congregata]CAG5096021.1 Similar to Atf3: Activating transcription factor 3 (Drosophila melanogaster) [Cotesia congregata]
MYNLNVNVNPSPTATAGLLGVSAGEVTPRTPEIVNSLIAMTNPFENYSHDRCRDRTDSTSSGGDLSPPSVQHTCSQLIKEGLKLTLQTKRRAHNSGDESKKKTKKEYGSADDEEDDDSGNNSSRVGLTPEDEERRRRRRERNKIAATKCRLKKREKTVILVQESETLESQNHDLKSQIQELETQRRRLVDMLSLHGPTCLKQGNTNTNNTDTAYQQPYNSDPILLPFTDNYSTTLDQPQDCITIDFPVKIENYDSTPQNYYRQDSPYVPTSDAGCTV